MVAVVSIRSRPSPIAVGTTVAEVEHLPASATPPGRGCRAGKWRCWPPGRLNAMGQVAVLVVDVDVETISPRIGATTVAAGRCGKGVQNADAELAPKNWTGGLALVLISATRERTTDHEQDAS